MKIAYLLPSLDCTAPIKVMRLICNQMIKYGHCCHVYYLTETKHKLNFNCPTTKTSPGLSNIDIDSFDIVHSSGLRPDIFLSFKSHSNNTRFISTIHNFFESDFKSSYCAIVAKLAGLVWMKCLGRFDKVVTLSKTGVEYYRRWIKPECLTYAYNSIDDDFVYNDADSAIVSHIKEFKGNQKLIGCHAMLSKVKGIDIIIKALPNLPDYKLCIIGDGREMSNLRELAHKFKVENQILFLGYINNAQRYLKLYDIFAIPSRSEGFSLVLLEAARQSCVTVCSDLPIFREIFRKGDVLYFKSDSPQSFVDILYKKRDENQLKENIHSQYLKNYTVSNLYNRYYSIYEGKI